MLRGYLNGSEKACHNSCVYFVNDTGRFCTDDKVSCDSKDSNWPYPVLYGDLCTGQCPNSHPYAKPDSSDKYTCSSSCSLTTFFVGDLKGAKDIKICSKCNKTTGELRHPEENGMSRCVQNCDEYGLGFYVSIFCIPDICCGGNCTQV